MQGIFPFTWAADRYESRIGVMPRDGGDADIRWFEVDPEDLAGVWILFQTLGEMPTEET